LVRSIGLEARCFASGLEFLDQFNESQAGCIILDYQMPGLDGLGVQKALVEYNFCPPIIFITGNGDISFASKAFRHGAFDVFAKPFAAKSFLARVREAVQANHDALKNRTIAFETRNRLARLTPREREIAELLAAGESCKQIAQKLSISAKTAENHRAAVLHKMAADNPTQLAHKLLIVE